MSPTVYTFIDGAAFDAALEELGTVFDATYKDLNWQALTKNSQRTFYFDALPRQKDGEEDGVYQTRLREKHEKFSFLKRVPGMHVREGFTRIRDNSRRPALQQKGVDVALAVEVLRQTHRENMDVARLFLNDLDFFPLLEALTDTRVVSELCYRPKKTAAELVEASDRSEPFDQLMLFNCLNQAKRDAFSLEGWSPEGLASTRIVATGANRHGEVDVAHIAETGKYGLRGGQVGGTYLVASNCLELLISHYEAVAQCSTEWSDGWEPQMERSSK